MMTNARLRVLKSNLTRAKNSNDPVKILQVCSSALSEFSRDGYPDCWHLWERAKYDAEYELSRQNWRRTAY